MTSIYIYRNLAVFNAAPPALLVPRLVALSGSEIWANRMADGRPYRMLEDLFAAAENNWFLLPQAEIVNAVALQETHPGKTDVSIRKEYQERFGFQMLADPAGEEPASITRRLRNSPADELRRASDIVFNLIEAKLIQLVEQFDAAGAES